MSDVHPAAPLATPAEASAQQGPWRPVRNGPVVIAVCCLIAMAGGLAVLGAWRLPPFSSAVERTENAYVRGQTTIISPQVSGYVRQVDVADYQRVERGDTLVQIDDLIYRQRLEQARAQLAAQVSALDNSAQTLAMRRAAQVSSQAARINAQAQLDRARADMDRAEPLAADGSISRRELDQTRAALRQAQAALAQADAAQGSAAQDVRAVVVGKGGLAAGVEGARAAVRAAEIDLAHTRIVAPEGGVLGDVGVRVGQYVTNGSQLMFLVPPRRWVTANFKEAQTARMAPGQKAWFTVDALGGARLSGHVERIAPAAGSEFSVLKPDNATGNFTKVAQRISVRISIDPGQPLADRLRPGASVEASVDTRAVRR